MDLQGRIALITGTSSGIGYATALSMAEVGADIAIGYEQKEQAVNSYMTNHTLLVDGGMYPQ